MLTLNVYLQHMKKKLLKIVFLLTKKNAFAKFLNIFIACLYGKILWKNIFPRKNSFFMIYS